MNASTTSGAAIGHNHKSAASISALFVAACFLVAAPAGPSLAQTATSDQSAVDPPAGDGPAVAPPPRDPQKIEVLATLYLWLPWTTVGVHPRNPKLSNTSSTSGPGKMISDITWVPFMGEAEFRSGRYGVVLDYIHAPLSKGIDTGTVLLGSGSGQVQMDTGTAMFFYRAYQTPEQYLDLGAGVRAWGLGGGIELTRRRPLPPISVSGGAVWADPLIGARYNRDLGNGYSATAYTDFGGFGAGADVDWQVVGTVNYAKKGWPLLRLGFRTLNFNYNGPGGRFNVNTYGPYLGSTFRF